MANFGKSQIEDIDIDIEDDAVQEYAEDYLDMFRPKDMDASTILDCLNADQQREMSKLLEAPEIADIFKEQGFDRVSDDFFGPERKVIRLAFEVLLEAGYILYAKQKS